MKRWPALDIRLPAARGGDASIDRAGMFAAWLDDYAPTAITEIEPADGDGVAWRVFFATADARDTTADALAREWANANFLAVDVDDEAWAERSQALLTAIRVGCIVVTPPWDRDAARTLARGGAGRDPAAIIIVIEPSMGFGTGHHESTRLCLGALQGLTLPGRSVLDVGTGSGVLAIAAAALGSTRVLAIDDDPDALASAAANVVLNTVTDQVKTVQASLLTAVLPLADVVLANLTGALLRRAADTLRGAVAPDGCLIVSGFTEDERLAVEHAFAPLTVADAASEHGWLALTLRAN